jgi:hypothetical protein
MVLLLAVLQGASDSHAQTETQWYEARPLVLLPFANYSGTSQVQEMILPVLHAALDSLGVRYHTAQEIRPLLRRYRIRSVGGISSEGVVQLSVLTGAQYLMVGSFDVFKPDGVNPEVQISLRLVRARDMRLAKAVTVGRSCHDYTTWFDRGTVEDLEELVRRVVDEAMGEMGRPFLNVAAATAPVPECRSIAVVPFDSGEEGGFAGQLLTNLVLSRLVSAGYVCLEPGALRETSLGLGVLRRGEIDLETVGALWDRYRPCVILTGTVDRLEAAAPVSLASVPHLAFTVRLLDGSTGMVEWTWSAEADGDVTRSLLRPRRDHSLVPFCNQIVDGLVEGLGAHLEDRYDDGS